MVTLICMVVYLNLRKTEISEMIYKTQSVIVKDISYSDSCRQMYYGKEYFIHFQTVGGKLTRIHKFRVVTG